MSKRHVRDQQRAGRPRQGGFTLIEVLVVLAIISSGAALFLTFGPNRTRIVDFDLALSQAAQAAMAGRSLAVARGGQVLLSVDPSSRMIRVGGMAPTVLPPTISVALLPPPEAPNALAIRFNADGSASGGTLLVSDGRRTGRIVVTWLTGRIRIATAT